MREAKNIASFRANNTGNAIEEQKTTQNSAFDVVIRNYYSQNNNRPVENSISCIKIANNWRNLPINHYLLLLWDD